ncbi:MAG: hypothetical protein LUD43_05440 [Firmicutes bacterium]|nr:hypothetical protein [Bacillota bacterium]
MKKFVSMLLALTLIFCMTALTACGDGEEEETTDAGTTAGSDTTDAATDEVTSEDTEADTDENTSENTDEETDAATDGLTNTANYYEYDWESINGVMPASIEWDWGAPDAESVYFVIDEDHVIHDGKGTWESSTDSIATAVFDQDLYTYYDCDEYLDYQTDSSDTGYGIVLYDALGLGEDWINTEHTGYVGAYIEEGVVIHQIRYFPRTSWTARMLDGYFEASVDGENWTTLFVVEDEPTTGDLTLVDVDDDTVYYYVRYVCETGCYCNIAEFEIWGVAGE